MKVFIETYDAKYELINTETINKFRRTHIDDMMPLIEQVNKLLANKTVTQVHVKFDK